jgi:glycosyltransferase involved in cell wall biosynthesis
MRVGVYLAGLNPSYVGGLTTYAIGLLNGLIDNHRGCKIVIFVSDGARMVLADRIKNAPHVEWVALNEPPARLADRLALLPVLDALHERARNRRMRRVSERISAACDVVLFPLCFMATYRLEIPSIVSFHDLQHEAYPQFFDWRALRARRVNFGASFRHASMIQASSIAMKNEALRIYGDRLTPQRIAVIPEGVEYAVFSGRNDEDARRHYRLPEEFMFYPAQLWHHKNHLRLLEALDLLQSRDGVRIPLALSGGEYEAAPAVRGFIASHGLEGQVFVLGKVPFASLLSLYRQASYIVSASLHESNCLPVLEAAASGSPIIASNIAPNLESAKVFRMRLFDPFDVENIAATLADAWQQRHANQEAVEANRKSALGFDWTVVAGMYLDQALRLAGSTTAGPCRPS